MALSNKIEQMICDRDFDDLGSMNDKELLILFDVCIEDESILDFHTIINVLQTRSDLIFQDRYFNYSIYLKACAFGQTWTHQSFDSDGYSGNWEWY